MAPASWDTNDSEDRQGATPSVDDLLAILAHPLRREVISYCVEADENILDVEDVVDDIVAARAAAGAPVERDRLLVECHHQHLPVLADHGVIVFDPQSRQLRYRRDDRLERLLRQIEVERQG